MHHFGSPPSSTETRGWPKALNAHQTRGADMVPNFSLLSYTITCVWLFIPNFPTYSSNSLTVGIIWMYGDVLSIQSSISKNCASGICLAAYSSRAFLPLEGKCHEASMTRIFGDNNRLFSHLTLTTEATRFIFTAINKYVSLWRQFRKLSLCWRPWH